AATNMHFFSNMAHKSIFHGCRRKKKGCLEQSGMMRLNYLNRRDFERLSCNWKNVLCTCKSFSACSSRMLFEQLVIFLLAKDRSYNAILQVTREVIFAFE